MEKVIGVFVCMVLIAAAETVVLKDGVYTGQAKGYKGPVRVAVTVKEGRIAGVKVIECSDGRAKKVVKEIPRRIVSTNCVDVDIVSGATLTSRAVKEAVRQALGRAH